MTAPRGRRAAPRDRLERFRRRLATLRRRVGERLPAFAATVRRVRADRRERRRRRVRRVAPRRRIDALDGVYLATVGGRVASVAGDGPAVVTRVADVAGVPRVVGRTTRPFVVTDGTGDLRVRVPPDGVVVHGDGASDDDGGGGGGRSPAAPGVASVCRGDPVTVTGRLVRGGTGERTMTGPAFLLVSPA